MSTTIATPQPGHPEQRRSGFDERAVFGLRLASWPMWQTVGLLSVCLAVVLLRWLGRSHYLFDLDSILYARALDNFDLRLAQPPLPGYLLYVELGRLVRLGLGDANLSLEVISACFGVGLAAALYALCDELFDARTGVVAVLLALTGPVFWYQSSFASPRIAEGFFATLIVWMGIRLRRRGEPLTFWLLPVVVAVAGGVRQQVLLYLVPFCIWATWRTPLRWRIGGAILGSALVFAWLVPTLAAAGGLGDYRRLSSDQWQAFVVNQTGVFYAQDLGELVQRLATNIGLLLAYGFFVCPLAILVVAIAMSRGLDLRRIAADFGARAILIATLPALLFFVFIHIQQIGHVLVVAPFLALGVARALTWLPPGRRTASLIVGVLAANVLFVCFAPSRLVADRIGTPTNATLRERDRFVASAVSAITAGTPAETVVLTTPLGYGFVEEYARGYTYLLLPGLFEPRAGVPLSRVQRVLSNGVRDVSDSMLLAPGKVLLPEGTRRIVTVGYEVDLSRAWLETGPVTRPDPESPSTSVVQTSGPATLDYGPSRLTLVATPPTVATN